MSLLNMTIKPLNRFEQASRSVHQDILLELLNLAVWAPNHKLREPWRFIYLDQESGRKLNCLRDEPAAHLIIVNELNSVPSRQAEDTAATFCLIQNFQILAWQHSLAVNITFPEWKYDNKVREKLKVTDKEHIVAVLELGYVRTEDIIGNWKMNKKMNIN
ncbi:hypothetical protein [Paenibacillus sp. MER 99-2]|uniref:hypothetical protein n=1 Tax=Paenibacillus sp. MER 99-2 TaxID=2939572 RepID=UPI00203BF322|nr:hypothetical protein [Paenibacillus sp. MER 99-2]MCM3172327.1 hypothetical protein [Paenibacillus sp. MER 99-2]